MKTKIKVIIELDIAPDRHIDLLGAFKSSLLDRIKQVVADESHAANLNAVVAPPERFAKVGWLGNRTVGEIARYLPANYRVSAISAGDDVIDVTPLSLEESYHDYYGDDVTVVYISGVDSHGWTLDDYVIPRLSSGLIGAEEVPCIPG